jgi:hypothetical protein
MKNSQPLSRIHSQYEAKWQMKHEYNCLPVHQPWLAGKVNKNCDDLIGSALKTPLHIPPVVDSHKDRYWIP